MNPNDYRLSVQLRRWNWGHMQVERVGWYLRGAFFAEGHPSEIQFMFEMPSSRSHWVATLKGGNTLEMKRAVKGLFSAWRGVPPNSTFIVNGIMYRRCGPSIWESSAFQHDHKVWTDLAVATYETWRRNNPRLAWALDQLGVGGKQHREYLRDAMAGSEITDALWHVADAIEWAQRSGLDVDVQTAWSRWNERTP